MAQGQQAESRALKAQPSMPVLALTLKASVLGDDTPASTVQTATRLNRLWQPADPASQPEEAEAVLESLGKGSRSST